MNLNRFTVDDPVWKSRVIELDPRCLVAISGGQAILEEGEGLKEMVIDGDQGTEELLRFGLWQEGDARTCGHRAVVASREPRTC
jgi:hypothetical protein